MREGESDLSCWVGLGILQCILWILIESYRLGVGWMDASYLNSLFVYISKYMCKFINHSMKLAHYFMTKLESIYLA